MLKVGAGSPVREGPRRGHGTCPSPSAASVLLLAAALGLLACRPDRGGPAIDAPPSPERPADRSAPRDSGRGDHAVDARRDALRDARRDQPPPKQDSGADARDGAFGVSIKVAAVQYGPGGYSSVAGCSDDLCGLSSFVAQAKAAGAGYVVTPEYAVVQTAPELPPNLGDKPATDPRWPAGSITKTLTALADALDVVLIFHLLTSDGIGSPPKTHGTLLAIDGGGAVLARHHKYQLYNEPTLSPGTACCDLFSTPVGSAALVICADINCVIDFDTTTPYCSPSGLQMMNALVAKKPRVLFFSSYWSAWLTQPAWQPIAIQSKFAKYAGAYLAASNVAVAGTYGGGIYKPDGAPIQTSSSPTPSVVYAVIPAP
jgi:predicted amidohydrolase